ncbi:MAG: SUF system Fe-S cluster assembly protein [Pseudomonadota bacterium]|nr:SUF system Fe-S cluster assembly protein [Pseudomonadota bacterium]
MRNWLHKSRDDESGDAVDTTAIEQRIVDVLKTIFDPEIPVNIYDLGLIYGIDVDDKGAVSVDMTLTSPGCPVAQTFPGMVEGSIRQVEGVMAATVNLVWEPPWRMDTLSDEVKLQLGLL